MVPGVVPGHITTASSNWLLCAGDIVGRCGRLLLDDVLGEIPIGTVKARRRGLDNIAREICTDVVHVHT